MWTVEEQATALIGKADGWRMKKKRRRFADCDQARLLEYKIFSFIYFDVSLPRENDHTMMTAPHPVRSAKLSIIGLS